MPQTLPLSLPAWDLELDAGGNWNLTDEDSSIAQDVASAIRTFQGECWYNIALGMPYFEMILGKLPPASLITANITQQAQTIANVADVRVVSLRLANRVLTGTVVVTRADNPSPLVASF